MATDITTKDYEEKVLKSEGLKIVDYWADWCGPCHALAPIIEDVAKEGKVDLMKVNIDKNQDVALQEQVMGIPTVKIFKDGKAVETVVGVRQKHEYMALLEKHA
jgi:thioredoxin 1